MRDQRQDRQHRRRENVTIICDVLTTFRIPGLRICAVAISCNAGN
jgi:hypothetical protein